MRAATILNLSDSPVMRRMALRSLLKPTEQRVMDADYLTQTVNTKRPGAERYVLLWRKAGKHANPQRDDVIGRTTRPIVDRLTQAGLLRFDRAERTDHSDTGQHHWYPEWPA